MRPEKIKLLYSEVIEYLRKRYIYDEGSVIPRSRVYDDYLIYQNENKTPTVSKEHMGNIVRVAFSYAAGDRVQITQPDGSRIGCYYLKQSKKSIFFLNIFF